MGEEPKILSTEFCRCIFQIFNHYQMFNTVDILWTIHPFVVAFDMFHMKVSVFSVLYIYFMHSLSIFPSRWPPE